MARISEIVKVRGIQYAIIPSFAVAKAYGIFEIYVINKDGIVFPIIDEGFNQIDFQNQLLKWYRNGAKCGIIVNE